MDARDDGMTARQRARASHTSTHGGAGIRLGLFGCLAVLVALLQGWPSSLQAAAVDDQGAVGDPRSE
ncbi:MAG: hypothetical protein ACR2JC_02390 [Chloroflexota bacterium]